MIKIDAAKFNNQRTTLITAFDELEAIKSTFYLHCDSDMQIMIDDLYSDLDYTLSCAEYVYQHLLKTYASNGTAIVPTNIQMPFSSPVEHKAHQRLLKDGYKKKINTTVKLSNKLIEFFEHASQITQRPPR